MSLRECTLHELPRIDDPRGSLTFIEANRHIPFDIRRVYYIYDTPDGAERGGHAHKTLRQMIIAMSGSFDIHLDDGYTKKTVHLDRADAGLYVCQMIWRDFNNFSSDALCMVLASDYYNQHDYYYKYNEFIDDVKGRTA